MVRFKIAYNLESNLNPNEIDIQKSKHVKIIDLREELPALIVNDEQTAREWLKYLNLDPDKEKEINNKIHDTMFYFERYVDLNMKLIRPKEITVGFDEEDEPVMEMPLKEELFFDGYITKVNSTRKSIEDKLKSIKKIIES